MADWNFTENIAVFDCEWGQFFVGPRAALISANLAEPERFPGEPGNGKVSVKYLDGSHEIKIRKVSTHRFEVYRPFANDEQRAAAYRRKQEQEAKEARARMAKPQPRYGEATRLVAQLAKRYPGAHISAVEVKPFRDGFQQTVRLTAPLSTLLEDGLVTQSMIENAHRFEKTTSVGDGYCLFVDPNGQAELSLHTESEPRGRDRFSVECARKLLRGFTLRSKSALPTPDGAN